MNRRGFLIGITATVTVAAVPTIAFTDLRIRWQSWPLGMARPDEWAEGSGSLKFFLGRMKPVWPDAVWEVDHR